MKLVIQIPAYNEAATLPAVLAELPRSLPGLDCIETLVIDDGSSDGTAAAARAAGASHVLRLKRHAGLAAAFTAGLDVALELGADLIVNTDADHQYRAADLPTLIAPLLAGRADLAVGDRGVAGEPSFSPLKRWLQRCGSRVVSAAAGFPVPDAASGFRAFTREAALRTVVAGSYTYTLETLIQAGAYHLAVVFVPVRSNPACRPSRLMRGPGDYLLHSAAAILRAWAMYRPLRFFTPLGGALLLAGAALLFFYLVAPAAGQVQTLLLAAVLLLAGIQTVLVGLLADLLAFNRRMLEEALYRARRRG